MNHAVVCRSEAETRALGGRLARACVPGLVITLEGELGAGKTTLVQGLVEGLAPGAGIRVRSPTYALCHAYPTTPRLWHADLYRLATAADVRELGLLDPVGPQDVLVVEWASRAAGLFAEALHVDLGILEEDVRRVDLNADGAVAQAVLEKLMR